MNINNMISKLKNHAQSEKIGMITTHLGIVRGTSRDGREVTGIEVKYDYNVIDSILNDIKQMPGIIDVLVDTREGKLSIGDEILAVAVGGDIRENVFKALMETVNRIKAEASRKKEEFRV